MAVGRGKLVNAPHVPPTNVTILPVNYGDTTQNNEFYGLHMTDGVGGEIRLLVGPGDSEYIRPSIERWQRHFPFVKREEGTARFDPTFIYSEVHRDDWSASALGVNHRDISVCFTDNGDLVLIEDGPAPKCDIVITNIPQFFEVFFQGLKFIEDQTNQQSRESMLGVK